MPKKIVIWSPLARTELRAIDRDAARHILEGINVYLTTGAGDVIKVLVFHKLAFAPADVELIHRGLLAQVAGQQSDNAASHPQSGVPESGK
jgi:hypothetical protein